MPIHQSIKEGVKPVIYWQYWYWYSTRSLSGVGICDSMLMCPDVSYRTCTRNKYNILCKLEIDVFCKGLRERDTADVFDGGKIPSGTYNISFLEAFQWPIFVHKFLQVFPQGCTMHPYVWAPHVQNDAKYCVTSCWFNDKTKAK